MDFSTITDLSTLKALAYDQIAAKEIAQNTLNAINNRITELMQVQVAEAPKGEAPSDTTTETTTEAPANDSEPISGEVVGSQDA